MKGNWFSRFVMSGLRSNLISLHECLETMCRMKCLVNCIVERRVANGH
jgi:hypothetical protein